MKNQSVSRFMGKISGRAEIQLNVASAALAIEALEQLLIEKNVLKPDELMGRIAKLAQEKAKPPEPVVFPGDEKILPGNPGMDYELRD